MSESLYIVVVPKDGERHEYEYGNLEHAREHLNTEEQGIILVYNNGKQYFVEGKYKQYKTKGEVINE
jgi:hypothetical protein